MSNVLGYSSNIAPEEPFAGAAIAKWHIATGEISMWGLFMVANSRGADFLLGTEFIDTHGRAIYLKRPHAAVTQKWTTEVLNDVPKEKIGMLLKQCGAKLWTKKTLTQIYKRVIG